jgi:copper chaperone CopZ
MLTTVRIAGMTCQHCVAAVRTSLTAVPGIQSADVTIGAAAVAHDGTVTVEALREAIAVAGYSVTGGESRRGGLPIL